MKNFVVVLCFWISLTPGFSQVKVPALGRDLSFGMGIPKMVGLLSSSNPLSPEATIERIQNCYLTIGREGNIPEGVLGLLGFSPSDPFPMQRLAFLASLSPKYKAELMVLASQFPVMEQQIPQGKSLVEFLQDPILLGFSHGQRTLPYFEAHELTLLTIKNLLQRNIFVDHEVYQKIQTLLGDLEYSLGQFKDNQGEGAEFARSEEGQKCQFLINLIGVTRNLLNQRVPVANFRFSPSIEVSKLWMDQYFQQKFGWGPTKFWNPVLVIHGPSGSAKSLIHGGSVRKLWWNVAEEEAQGNKVTRENFDLLLIKKYLQATLGPQVSDEFDFPAGARRLTLSEKLKRFDQKVGSAGLIVVISKASHLFGSPSNDLFLDQANWAYFINAVQELQNIAFVLEFSTRTSTNLQVLLQGLQDEGKIMGFRVFDPSHQRP